MEQPFLQTPKLEKLQRNQNWWNLSAMPYTSLTSSNRLSEDTHMPTCFNNLSSNKGIIHLVHTQNFPKT